MFHCGQCLRHVSTIDSSCRSVVEALLPGARCGQAVLDIALRWCAADVLFTAMLRPIRRGAATVPRCVQVVVVQVTGRAL
eukprot:3675337-Prymnesium_polylepis.1